MPFVLNRHLGYLTYRNDTLSFIARLPDPFGVYSVGRVAIKHTGDLMASTESSQDSVALGELSARRIECWHQTPETRIPGPDAAAAMIDQVGVATLFAASPEIPNIYHAYMGDPNARAESEWNSPAGEVYGWRWLLGRREAAFYTALVRNRPTWVSWALLPAL